MQRHDTQLRLFDYCMAIQMDVDRNGFNKLTIPLLLGLEKGRTFGPTMYAILSHDLLSDFVISALKTK
jgi:hypothetical protein